MSTEFKILSHIKNQKEQLFILRLSDGSLVECKSANKKGYIKNENDEWVGAEFKCVGNKMEIKIK